MAAVRGRRGERGESILFIRFFFIFSPLFTPILALCAPPSRCRKRANPYALREFNPRAFREWPSIFIGKFGALYVRLRERVRYFGGSRTEVRRTNFAAGRRPRIIQGAAADARFSARTSGHATGYRRTGFRPVEENVGDAGYGLLFARRYGEI